MELQQGSPFSNLKEFSKFYLHMWACSERASERLVHTTTDEVGRGPSWVMGLTSWVGVGGALTLNCEDHPNFFREFILFIKAFENRYLWGGAPHSICGVGVGGDTHLNGGREHSHPKYFLFLYCIRFFSVHHCSSFMCWGRMCKYSWYL